MNIATDMFIGYIQNSDGSADYARQYQQMMSFAQEKGFVLGCVYSDNDFHNLKKIIQIDCEGIIINRISSIGPYLSNIKDNLLFCQKQNLKVFSQISCYFIFPPYLCNDSAAESVSPLGIG